MSGAEASASALRGAPGAHAWRSRPCVMGIDEAGRGPVLGAMVYGAAVCAVDSEPAVRAMGFMDSKVLKEERREELFEAMRAPEAPLAYLIDEIPAAHMSACMLRRSKVSLNKVGARAHTRAHAHARAHTHARTHTRTHAHARTHAHTHTHTHTHARAHVRA